MAPHEDDNSANFDVFRDALFDILVERSVGGQPKKSRKSRSKAIFTAQNGTQTLSSTTTAKENDADELVDFSDFVAGEIFPHLPDNLRTISHRAIQDDVAVSDEWSLPLSLTTYEEIVERVPPSVTDSLEAYGFIKQPKSDLQSFLSPIITAYLNATTAPPPKWIETKTSACEICERDWVPVTYHHLIPKAVHAKVLKRRWHEEQQLNSVAWLCRACHSFVHRMASNEELAKEYFTVERICEREDVQKWANWVGKVRWKKR